MNAEGAHEIIMNAQARSCRRREFSLVMPKGRNTSMPIGALRRVKVASNQCRADGWCRAEVARDYAERPHHTMRGGGVHTCTRRACGKLDGHKVVGMGVRRTSLPPPTFAGSATCDIYCG